MEPRLAPLDPLLRDVDEDLVADERSLNRLLVPRSVPRLEVLLWVVAMAVLVDVVVEVSVAALVVEEEEDEEEPLEELEDVPDEELVEPPPAEVGTEVLGELPPPLPLPRLPRSRGVMSAAKRSAAMVPDIRMVRFRSPVVTLTVGTTVGVAAPGAFRAGFRTGQNQAAIPATITTAARSHQPVLRGFFGAGLTIPGRGGTVTGPTPGAAWLGAEALLICHCMVFLPRDPTKGALAA